jgi:SAM-dependent methyltransferase
MNCLPNHTATLPPSPLTGTNAGVVVARFVDLSQLTEGYRHRLGLDISGLVAGVSSLRLLYDQATGLSFFDPPVTGDAAFYSALARHPAYHLADKAEFRIAAPHVPPGSRVLEVGAGVGRFTNHLQNVDYFGIEINPEAIAAGEALGIRIVNRSIYDMVSERSGYFDVTCAFQVLEHVADPRRMIEAMVALTRQGGKIILATPNAGGFISRSRNLLNAPPHHITWWEDRTWHWVASTLGLVDLQLYHTPIEDVLTDWAQMIASDGIARQLGCTLDPIVDESPLRYRIDALAEPIARTILAGVIHRGDVPEAGHTSVAVFTKPG